ncbi:MAG: hypothetical protein ABR552_01240, partial [Actinomycetota bacterium]
MPRSSSVRPDAGAGPKWSDQLAFVRAGRDHADDVSIARAGPTFHTEAHIGKSTSQRADLPRDVVGTERRAGSICAPFHKASIRSSTGGRA